jgi:hypothetical protein
VVLGPVLDIEVRLWVGIPAWQESRRFVDDTFVPRGTPEAAFCGGQDREADQGGAGIATVYVQMMGHRASQGLDLMCEHGESAWLTSVRNRPAMVAGPSLPLALLMARAEPGCPLVP